VPALWISPGVLKNRTYHYASAGAVDLAAGTLSMVETLAAPGDVVGMAVDTMSVGSKTLTGVTTNGTTHAIAENDYAEGFLFVSNNGGQGYTFLIEANEAIAASGGTGSITLYDPIVVAFNAATEVTLFKNPWQDIVEAAAGHAHVAAGVPQCVVTAGSWGWVQTWGPCAGEEPATAIAVGSALESGAAAGQFAIGDGAAQYLGVQINAAANGDFRGKFLAIMP
jgi:hypothetical protein